MTNKISSFIYGTGLTVLGLSTFFSPKTDAQTLSNKEKLNLQRGVQAGELLPSKSTDYYSTFGFKFNDALEKSVKSSKNPKINLSGKYPVGTFVRFNKDTSGIELQVPKDIDYKTAKPIGIVLRNGINVDICGDQKGNVGNKNTPITSFYFDPHQLYLKKGEFPTASFLDSLILNDIKYIRGKVDQIGDKVEGLEGKFDGLEGKVASIDSTVKRNESKLNYIIKKVETKEDSTESEGQKRLNLIASGIMGGPRYFSGDIQVNAINNEKFSLCPYLGFNLSKTESNSNSVVTFRENVPQGSNQIKERTDVYTTKSLENYLGEAGLRATLNLGKSVYTFVGVGANLKKEERQKFGNSYIRYLRDGVEVKPSNSGLIEGSEENKTFYRFLPEISAGLGVKIFYNEALDIALEAKISHEINKGGKTDASLGVSFGFLK